MRVIRKTETLADQAYNLLKKAITTGQLKAEESLPEERLANELGISRTPLRDALNRLAMEGLIHHRTGKPAVVASFTKEDSLNYMELRSILEVQNIQKIISKVDETFINELRENLSRQLIAIREDNYQTFIELDREFHLLLTQLNPNKEFRETVHRMNTGINRAFLILSSTVPESAKDAYQEHVEIVDSLEERDVLLARNKMVVHMNNVEKRFLKYYEKQEND